MSFKTHLQQILAITLTSISLVGCGGGGLFDNTPPYASFVKIDPPPTPHIVIYSSLDLANSIYTTPLRSCLPLNIKNPSWPYNYSQLNISSFSLNGNFTLPFGDDFSCRIQGMTGTVTSAQMTSKYALTNLNLDAVSVQATWREYWDAVVKQSGSVLISQPSNANLTCTTLMGQQIVIPGNPARDIKNELLKCLN